MRIKVAIEEDKEETTEIMKGVVRIKVEKGEDKEETMEIMKRGK